MHWQPMRVRSRLEARKAVTLGMQHCIAIGECMCSYAQLLPVLHDKQSLVYCLDVSAA